MKDKIQTLVRDKKLNQSKIARDLGVSRNAVNLVIQGRSTSRRIQAAIAMALCVDYEKLFPSARNKK